MASGASKKVHAYLLDRFHPLGSNPHVVLELDPIALRDMPVSLLMRTFQDQHRSQCKQGLCIHCPGTILVKSAWLLDKTPDPTAFHTTGSGLALDAVQHDPVRGVEFMMSGDLMSAYSDIEYRAVVLVLLECTFANNDPFFNRSSDKSTEKRQREHVNDKEGKRARVEVAPYPKGLCVVPFPKDPTAPLNILPPSFTFTSCIEHPGVVWIDKTRYIPVLDLLLRMNTGCIVALPPGTGKSHIGQILQAWYDIEGDKNTFTELFFGKSSPDISFLFNKRSADIQAGHTWAYYWSSRKCLCLVFNFGEIEDSNGFDFYLLKVLHAFISKYEEHLGTLVIDSKEPPISILDIILKRVSSQDLKLFLAVDHWDYPILRSLPSGDGDASFVKVIDFLVAMARSRQRLLILGNLSPMQFLKVKVKDNTPKRLKDISLHRDLNGAFGMTGQELEDLFQVLSCNRYEKLDSHAAALTGKLGHSSPPSLDPEDVSPPLGMYNFQLVLSYAAVALNLDSPHQILADSPALEKFLQCCGNLLKHSSLRRGRQMTIPPILGIDRTSLLRCTKNEEYLWQVLFYLGVIKIVHVERDRDPMWTAEISNSSIANQLFAAHPLTLNVRETTRDIQLRALLERNPRPMMAAIANRLSRRPLRTLYGMKEEGFQELIDSFMEDNLIFNNPSSQLDTKQRSPKYINQYFSQLGLATKVKGNSNAQTNLSGKGKGPTKPQPQISGTGPFGYLDIFICDLRDLHPGRVVAMELKYVSLFSLFRVMHTSHEGCEKAVYRDGGKFTENCLLKIEELDKMSTADLRNLEHWYYNSDEQQGKIRKIGVMLNDAVIQLQSYMDAIVHGRVITDVAGNVLTTGITNAEKRVAAIKATPIDEVLGFVVCGIGRRIIAIPVEPTTPNTQYKYQANANWQAVFERKSKGR
ncbi:hypothetical protein B0H12DRAFT_1329469 [Mycena haematopus]|nr:hypothetical protein B0H12DRAFT_1329469 [Mycena haematopus]